MKINWNFNLLMGIGTFLLGWIASCIVEYLVAAVFGFPASTCVWSVIKLNVFIIAIIATVAGCTAGSYFMKEWQKEN